MERPASRKSCPSSLRAPMVSSGLSGAPILRVRTISRSAPRIRAIPRATITPPRGMPSTTVDSSAEFSSLFPKAMPASYRSMNGSSLREVITSVPINYLRDARHGSVPGSDRCGRHKAGGLCCTSMLASYQSFIGMFRRVSTQPRAGSPGGPKEYRSGKGT
ncbi:conserved hypothetical protein [anaerobic digester metagenome]|uniref:Uncharacterized protein n=1 Tax=anaerobic digester metagenome TaxID=1263854 RepID=A0A485LYV7_9ZZZZ